MSRRAKLFGKGGTETGTSGSSRLSAGLVSRSARAAPENVLAVVERRQKKRTRRLTLRTEPLGE